METLISSMIASGRSVNRPPHILLLMTNRSYPPLFVAPIDMMNATAPSNSRILRKMTNDTPESHSPAPAPTRRIPYVIGAVVIGAVIGYAGVYGLGGLKRNASGDSACASAVSLSQRIAPLAPGELAALTMATAPLRLPDLTFQDAEGKQKKLSDWRGHTLLVNLWA